MINNKNYNEELSVMSTEIKKLGNPFSICNLF
jgi:hypothetical protein